MKPLLQTNSFLACLIIIGILVFTNTLLADASGRTGRTLKSGTTGCSCHSSQNNAVTVTISGPDTLLPTMQGTYTVKITGGPMVSGGVDIASSTGTLAIVTSDLKASSGELVHKSAKIASSGSVTFQFKFTPSSTIGNQTLYATGISCNNTGGTGGDQWNFAANKIVKVVATLSAEENVLKPGNYFLAQNYPNPFNPSTLIKYSLPAGSFVSLKVYNSIGKEVADLVNGFQAAHEYAFKFDASNLSSGIYYYTIKAGNNFVQTKKMIVIK